MGSGAISISRALKMHRNDKGMRYWTLPDGNSVVTGPLQ